MSGTATVLFIVGPTGAGKSELAFRVARKWRGEIVSADSMQVYKGMDIGTGKPIAAWRRLIRHHLIDILPPSREFSAYEYRDLALCCLEKIKRRGRLPIVAGGTGLYVKALVDGLSSQPGKNDAIREKLSEEAGEKGLESLYDLLRHVDAESALRVHPHDQKRIIRALEVFENSGKTLSDWQKETVPLNHLGYRCLMVGLHTDRGLLYKEIDRRVDAMFRRGWISEAKRLRKIRLSRTAEQAIGYREIFEYLADRSSDLKQIRDTIKQHTRNYAKRQLTWFRSDKRIFWLEESGAKGLKAVGRLLGGAVEN